MQAPWHAETHLLAHSGAYARTRSVRRTKRHAQFEHFVAALALRLGPERLGQAPSAEQLCALRREFHTGAFGPCESLRRLLTLFGPSGLHAQLLEAFQAQPTATTAERRLFVQWNARLAKPHQHRSFRRNVLALAQLLRTTPGVEHTRRRKRAQRDEPGVSDTWESCDPERLPEELGRQVHSLPPRLAARFCLTNGVRTDTRLALLQVLSYGQQEELARELTRYERGHAEALRLARRVPALNNPLRCANLLLELLDARNLATVEATLHEPVEELCSSARQLGERYSHVLLALAVLADEQANGCLATALRAHASARMVPERTTKARLAALSDWHVELYRRVEQHERAHPRGHFEQRRLALHMQRFARVLLLLQEEVVPAASSLRDFLRGATSDTLAEAVRRVALRAEVRNERVKSRHEVHHAKVHAQLALRVLRQCAQFGEGLDALGSRLAQLRLPQILRRIPNRRVAADARRNYTDDEMQRMQRACADPCEALLFTLLQQIALRNSALGHLQYGMLLDEQHRPRELCHVPEKNGHTRAFCASPSLREAVARAAQFVRGLLERAQRPCELSRAYLLNPRSPWRPLSSFALQRQLQRLARRAGVGEGVPETAEPSCVKVHPHAFRHTLVDRLLRVGNPLELVAKFMDHQDVYTTAHFYLATTPEELRARLVDPFAERFQQQQLQESETLACLRVANRKVKACRHIIELFRAHCDQACLDKVRAALPKLEALLAAIDQPLGDELC